MDPRTMEAEDLLCDDSFLRYCRGEAHSDVEYWEEWISRNPDKLPVLNKAKRLFEVLNLGQGNRIEQLAILKDALDRQSRFKEQVLGETTGARPVTRAASSTNAKPGGIIRSIPGSFLKYAASIIILAGLGVLAYIKYGKKAPAQLYAYEYFTKAHGHRTVVLPDSSLVMLNENSHLSINPDFDALHRQVSITGEAFFDIKHDAAHPFLVNTRSYQIRVLGTSFNVRSYADRETETTLLTGNIEIVQNTSPHPKDKIVLKPNQKLVFLPGSGKGKVIVPDIDTSTHRLVETSWARRKMEISDKTLGEIAEQLESWYGIKIQFKDTAVKNYRYTATFDDETVFSILQYLQQSYPFAYLMKDDCIVIASN